MSKWQWAFGSTPLIQKWKWAVTAGDQDPESEDDKKCGEHYIAEDKDCQDGDAHRPDPGNNPYWQGGRKGPEDKSTDTSKRDRKEVTKKAKKKESERETPTTPDIMADWADDRLREYMEETEMAHRDSGDGFTWESEQGAMKLHELAEETLRDTAREFAGNLDTRKKNFNDPEDTRTDPDVEHREMYRRKGKPITFDEPKHGTPVHVPKSPGRGVYKDLIDRVKFGKKAGDALKDADEAKKKEGQEDRPDPDRKGAVKHTKELDKGSEKEAVEPEQSVDPVGDKMQSLTPEQHKKFNRWLRDKAKKGTLEEDVILEYMKTRYGESGVAASLNWAIAIASENGLLALDSALPPLPGDTATSETPALFDLPGDSAEARPCGEGEDPERGHCKDPRQAGPAGPMSDDPKLLRKMGPGGGGGGQPPAPPKGVGLDMQEDPQRKARTATHVQVMKNSDPKDPKRTSWALNKMFGGSAIKQTPKGMGGTSQPMAENIARQQYDDARHTMEQSGWQETSNMGGRTTWSKGGGNITMQTGPSGNQGQYTNQFLVHTPKAQPKRGLFGRK